MRKLTQFTFYKNTPLTDLKNTIYFNSNTERDNFFNTHYNRIEFEEVFNFIRDRFTIRINVSYNDFKGVNYCSFVSEYEPNLRYYCFVPEYKYINDNVIEVNLLIDGIMTYCQGVILDDLEGITIKRQHLTRSEYNNNLTYLKNNDDVLKTHTKKYFHEDRELFDDFSILIESTCDLNANFGDVDNPNMETSTGATIDGVTSPVDLYLIEQNDFKNVMNKLKKFPWITQNFTKIALVPSVIISKSMTTLNTLPINNSSVSLTEVVKITGGETFSSNTIFESLNKNGTELQSLYDLNEDEIHLLRSEYTTIEINNWINNTLLLNVGMLPNTRGLHLVSNTIGGYDNKMVVFPLLYNSSQSEPNDYYGSFLNSSLLFDNFDDVPILIDNYNLAMSKSANQRAYAESNLFTKRLGRIVAPDNTLEDRLASAVSVLSNINPMQIGQALVDEYNFYRQKKAEQADLQLTPDSVTKQSNTNALAIYNEFYGLSVKYSKPNDYEYDLIKKYYKLYGFQVDKSNSKLSYTHSMTICNYVEFEGSYQIEGIERSILDIMKIQFENGVRLWHNNNTPNPFTQNILNNTWR